MSRVEIAIILVLMVLLVLQGGALLSGARRERYHAWSGLLSIAAALFTGLGLWLFETHDLVIFAPLGAMIVDDRAHLLLRLLLVLLSVGGGVLIESARAARGRKPRPRLLVGAGLLVGLFAAARVCLQSSADSHISVYAYDMWSPVPLCWIGFCVAQWVLVVLESKNRAFALWVGTAVVAALTLAGAGRPDDLYLAPETAALWRFLLIAGWAAALSSGLRVAALILFCRALGPAHSRRRRWVAFGSICLGIASLRPLLHVVRSVSFHSGWAAGVTLVVLALLLIVGIIRVDRNLRSKMAKAVGLAGATAQGEPEAAADEPLKWSEGRRWRIFALALIPTLMLVVTFSADLLYFERWAKSVDLAGLAITALVLIELTSEGPLLDAGPTIAFALWGGHSFVRRAVTRLFSTARSLVSRLMASPGPEPPNGSTITRTLGKVTLAIALLVVIQELPNHGRTLLYPFSGHSLPPDKAILGEAVSERVSNTMAALVSQLKSEVLVASSSGDKLAMIPVDHPNGLEAVLQDDSIMIGPLKIPLGALLTPLREPLQTLFGARLIKGSVQLDGTGDYHMLVSSSDGETWHVSTATSTPAVPLPPSGPTAAPPAQGTPPTLLNRADALAYLIVTSDPVWTRSGMTTNPKAFETFHRGLEHWSKFEAMDHDYLAEELETSIDQFRQAVDLDPQFAVAYYRLGLALRSDDRPTAAIRAFQAAIAANPRYGEAQNALASTLFDFQAFVQRPPATLADRAGDSEHQKFDAARRAQARQIWDNLIASPDTFPAATDRGSAYLGLCKSFLRSGFDGGDENPQKAGRDRLALLQAFYFCTRADVLYEEEVHSTPASLASTRAEIATDLGYAIRVMGEDSAAGSGVTTSLGCDDENAEVPSKDSGTSDVKWTLSPSRLEASAASYFERAQRLAPSDPMIACNAVHSQMLRGNERPMRTLLATAAGQIYLGTQFIEREKRDRDPLWFRKAIDAFDRALEIEPYNLDALNGYAYAFWLWRNSEPDVDPDWYPSLGGKAERAARLAVRLSAHVASQNARAVYESTLGEVLMALGRPHEAIAVLESAVAQTPKHSLFDEVRWDLGRAYACATLDDRNDDFLPLDEECSGLLDEAATLYDEIRERDGNREEPIYTTLGLLDATVYPSACRKALPDPLPLVEIHYERGVHEREMAVQATTGSQGAAIHVWGNGVDEYADEANNWQILLSSKPFASHHHFFAQVVSDDRQHPLSAVFTFPTRQDIEENMIVLQIP